jgi:plasmid stability protein
MANLTIAVDDDLLRRARIRALEAGTSVNALLRNYLESFVGDEGMAKRQAIVAHAEQSAFEIGPRSWSRGDLHR